MNGPTDLRHTTDDGRTTAGTSGGPALSEEELLALDGELIPHREAMSTLIWAPAPGAIAPPVEEILPDESL